MASFSSDDESGYHTASEWSCPSPSPVDCTIGNDDVAVDLGAPKSPTPITMYDHLMANMYYEKDIPDPKGKKRSNKGRKGSTKKVKVAGNHVLRFDGYQRQPQCNVAQNEAPASSPSTLSTAANATKRKFTLYEQQWAANAHGAGPSRPPQLRHSSPSPPLSPLSHPSSMWPSEELRARGLRSLRPDPMHNVRGAEVIKLNEWKGDDDDDDLAKPFTDDKIRALMIKYPIYFSEEEHKNMFPDYVEVVCTIDPRWNDLVLRCLKKGKFRAHKEPKDRK